MSAKHVQTVQVEWLDNCNKCGYNVACVTTEGNSNYLYSGESVSCQLCGHSGVIDADGYGAYVAWDAATSAFAQAVAGREEDLLAEALAAQVAELQQYVRRQAEIEAIVLKQYTHASNVLDKHLLRAEAAEAELARRDGPVMTEAVRKSLDDLRKKLTDCNRLNYCASAYKAVEDTILRRCDMKSAIYDESKWKLVPVQLLSDLRDSAHFEKNDYEQTFGSHIEIGRWKGEYESLLKLCEDVDELLSS